MCNVFWLKSLYFPLLFPALLLSLSLPKNPLSHFQLILLFLCYVCLFVFGFGNPMGLIRIIGRTMGTLSVAKPLKKMSPPANDRHLPLGPQRRSLISPSLLNGRMLAWFILCRQSQWLKFRTKVAKPCLEDRVLQHLSPSSSSCAFMALLCSGPWVLVTEMSHLGWVSIVISLSPLTRCPPPRYRKSTNSSVAIDTIIYKATCRSQHGI